MNILAVVNNWLYAVSLVLAGITTLFQAEFILAIIMIVSGLAVCPVIKGLRDGTYKAKFLNKLLRFIKMIGIIFIGCIIYAILG